MASLLGRSRVLRHSTDTPRGGVGRPKNNAPLLFCDPGPCLGSSALPWKHHLRLQPLQAQSGSRGDSTRKVRLSRSRHAAALDVLRRVTYQATLPVPSEPPEAGDGLLLRFPALEFRSLLLNAIGRESFPDRAVWKRNKVELCSLLLHLAAGDTAAYAAALEAVVGACISLKAGGGSDKGVTRRQRGRAAAAAAAAALAVEAGAASAACAGPSPLSSASSSLDGTDGADSLPLPHCAAATSTSAPAAPSSNPTTASTSPSSTPTTAPTAPSSALFLVSHVRSLESRRAALRAQVDGWCRAIVQGAGAGAGAGAAAGSSSSGSGSSGGNTMAAAAAPLVVVAGGQGQGQGQAAAAVGCSGTSAPAPSCCSGATAGATAAAASTPTTTTGTSTTTPSSTSSTSAAATSHRCPKPPTAAALASASATFAQLRPLLERVLGLGEPAPLVDIRRNGSYTELQVAAQLEGHLPPGWRLYAQATIVRVDGSPFVNRKHLKGEADLLLVDPDGVVQALVEVKTAKGNPYVALYEDVGKLLGLLRAVRNRVVTFRHGGVSSGSSSTTSPSSSTTTTTSGSSSSSTELVTLAFSKRLRPIYVLGCGGPTLGGLEWQPASAASVAAAAAAPAAWSSSTAAAAGVGAAAAAAAVPDTVVAAAAAAATIKGSYDHSIAAAATAAASSSSTSTTSGCPAAAAAATAAATASSAPHQGLVVPPSAVLRSAWSKLLTMELGRELSGGGSSSSSSSSSSSTNGSSTSTSSSSSSSGGGGGGPAAVWSSVSVAALTREAVVLQLPAAAVPRLAARVSAYFARLAHCEVYLVNTA